MQKSNKRANKERQLAATQAKKEARLLAPPSLKSTINFTHTYRFRIPASTTGVTVTTADLAGLLALCSTATTSWLLATQVRIKSVEMWAPMGASLTPITLSVEWLGSADFGGGSVKVTDTSMSSTRCAHVHVKPKANSINDQWRTPGTTGVFTYVCPIDTILDLRVQFALNDGEFTPPITIVGPSALGSLGSIAWVTGVTALGLPTITK